jgi:hypothetical protein
MWCGVIGWMFLDVSKERIAIILRGHNDQALRNVGNHSPNDAASHATQPHCWTTPRSCLLRLLNLSYPHKTDEVSLPQKRRKISYVYFNPLIFFLLGGKESFSIKVLFIPQLMHKCAVFKKRTMVKFTLKQLQHVSVQSHHHQEAHYSCLPKLQLLTHWGRGHLNCLNASSRGF